MGGDVAGPSSQELGYLRRWPRGSGRRSPQEGPPGRRRWLWVALLVAVLVMLAISFVVRPTQSEIATRAVGSWREIGTPERFRLVLDVEGAAGLYLVSYARVEGEYAELRGDTIVILRVWGGSEISCTLTYDSQRDRLTATTGRGTFTLERTR